MKKALADHSDLEEELGDVLFTLIQLSNELNLDLTTALEKSFKRYTKKLNKLKEETA